jgi:hypothetical protein
VVSGLNLGYDLPFPVGEHQSALLFSGVQRAGILTPQQPHTRQVVTGNPTGHRPLFKCPSLVGNAAHGSGYRRPDYANNGYGDEHLQ